MAGAKTLEVVRFRITDAGREALAEVEHEFKDES
jgi:hypothetical protein